MPLCSKHAQPIGVTAKYRLPLSYSAVSYESYQHLHHYYSTSVTSLTVAKIQRTHITHHIPTRDNCMSMYMYRKVSLYLSIIDVITALQQIWLNASESMFTQSTG